MSRELWLLRPLSGFLLLDPVLCNKPSLRGCIRMLSFERPNDVGAVCFLFYRKPVYEVLFDAEVCLVLSVCLSVLSTASVRDSRIV